MVTYYQFSRRKKIPLLMKDLQHSPPLPPIPSKERINVSQKCNMYEIKLKTILTMYFYFISKFSVDVPEKEEL